MTEILLETLANLKKTNRYLQGQQPWALAKNFKNDMGDKRLRAHIDCTVYHCVEAIRIVGILLQPYMPEKAAQLLDMIGVDESRRTFDDAKLGADDAYGTSKVPVGRDAWDGLFPPLPVET